MFRKILTLAVVLFTSFFSLFSLANTAMFVTPSGELYVLITNDTDTQLVLTKFDNQGKLDPSFGIDGKVHYEVPGLSSEHGLYVPTFKVNSRGEVFIVGQPHYPQGGPFAYFITKLNSGGFPSDFGRVGSVWHTEGLPYSAAVQNLEVNRKGEIYVISHEKPVGHGVPSRTEIRRHSATGDWDPTYGGDNRGRLFDSDILGNYVEVERISEVRDGGHGKLLITGRLRRNSYDPKNPLEPFTATISETGPIRIRSQFLTSPHSEHVNFFPALNHNRDGIFTFGLEYRFQNVRDGDEPALAFSGKLQHLDLPLQLPLPLEAPRISLTLPLSKPFAENLAFQVAPSGKLLLANVENLEGDLRVRIFYPNGTLQRSWNCEQGMADLDSD